MSDSFLDLLDRHFNLEELRTLCFDLGIDYENLGGEGKRGNARELVSYAKRRGRAGELRDAVQARRPNVAWPPILAVQGLAEAAQRPVTPLPRVEADPRPVTPLPNPPGDDRPVVPLPNVAPPHGGTIPMANPSAGAQVVRSRSPFVVGLPLQADQPIFGRDDVLAELRRGLERFESANLVGERRMGKSSVLSHLRGNPRFQPRTKDGEPTLVVAFLDLQRQITSESRFYGSATRALLSASHSHEPWLAELLARLERTPEASYDEFERVLNALKASDQRPVLITDEFEQLLTLGPDNHPLFPIPFFNALRSLIGDGHLTMVISSRVPLVRYFADPARPGSLTSTFPNYFPVHQLAALERSAADALLLQPSDHTLTNRQVEQAWAWAGGHPCDLQCAGQAWYEANRDGLASGQTRQRFDEKRRQACFVSHSPVAAAEGAPSSRDMEGKPPTVPTTVAEATAYNPLMRVLKAVLVSFPVSVGRMFLWFSSTLDEIVAWFWGMVMIVLLILVIAGIASGTDLLAFLKQLVGVQ